MTRISGAGIASSRSSACWPRQAPGRSPSSREPVQTRRGSRSSACSERSIFSLAHRDWEGLTAGILPAKVVAHHPAPPAIVAASDPHGLPANCPPTVAERVEGAEITIDGGWAAASVAQCSAADIGTGAIGRDEFRFIDFGVRWWIVHLRLSDDPAAVEIAR